MSNSKTLVTGASGQLGALVVDGLAATHAPKDIAVLVRKDTDKAAFEAKGFDVRMGDYNDRAALETAFAGIERMLLVSSSEIGLRAPQHQNVIDAAKAAGVGYIAYTSILRADENAMDLAGEHKVTEAALAASGLDYTFLRNGWYNENLTGSVGQVLEMGSVFGAAQEGKTASATRADYAEAAVAVLTGSGHEGKVYELGGDNGYTMAEYAAMVADTSGKVINYVDMPQDAFTGALKGAGLPDALAEMFAD